MGIFEQFGQRTLRRAGRPGFGMRHHANRSPDEPISKLVITGASGVVATALRPMLSALFETVVLTDLREPASLHENESFISADLCDLEAIAALSLGANAILHLGGVSTEAEFDKLKDPNLLGTYNVFEAARLNGIQRVVFTSTLHTHGFYRRSEGFDEFSAPRPDSLYAATKLFGESVGYVYAQKHGIRTVCIRIGALAADAQSAEPGSWIGEDDLGNLITISLTHPDIKFEIFHGLSNHRKAPWRKLRARLFGYRPTTANESYPASVNRAKRKWRENQIAAEVRGATFAARNFDRKA